MEVGEPVSVAPPGSMPPDVAFAAELVSVTFTSSLKISHDKSEITGPHWEQGKDADVIDDWKATAKLLGLPPEPYSKKAALYLVKGAGGSYDVEVKVKVTKSENVSGDAKLVGNFKGLMIEGTCPTGAGEHTVKAKFTEPPDSVQGYRGKIGWGLEVAAVGGSVGLGTSIGEVYFILGNPTVPFAANPVWTEVLRFLCGKVGVTGKKDADSINASVTRYCHGAHGLHYDTSEGEDQYGWKPGYGQFKLMDYMKKVYRLCNCYDQASALQVFLAALGIHVAWCYLEPFGYIKPTNLVGVGTCNNPFFGADSTKKLVPWNDPSREAFGNHAFAKGGGILDACAGPHTGTESPDQYLAASIDDTPGLYPGPWVKRPGKSSEIVVEADVTPVT